MNDILSMARDWLRHRSELALPDFILSAPLESLTKAAPDGSAESAPLPDPSGSFAAFKSGISPAALPNDAPAVPADPAPRPETPAANRQEELPIATPVLEERVKYPDTPRRAALVALYNEYKVCALCPHLAAARRHVVFGSGNPEATVMVVGEAPGQEEDAQGKPFVGAAGQLLTKMLSAISLDRQRDVFIANILKCRPPGNRNPDAAETANCLPILKKQIEIIQPKFLLLLGRVAIQGILGKTDSIAKLRAVMHTYEGITTIVTYHPAALLRSAEYKRPAWEDLQKLRELIKGHP